jgi:hypothetical protein
MIESAKSLASSTDRFTVSKITEIITKKIQQTGLKTWGDNGS